MEQSISRPALDDFVHDANGNFNIPERSKGKIPVKILHYFYIIPVVLQSPSCCRILIVICNDSSNTDWRMIAANQMMIFLIFVLGMFFAILMYCKTCARSAVRYSEPSMYQNNREDRQNLEPPAPLGHPYTFYQRAERPPPYSEACNAPPPYESPFNRASMLEPPPVYPETPKDSNSVSPPANQAFPIVHYI